MRLLTFILLFVSVSAFGVVPEPTVYFKFDETGGATVTDQITSMSGTVTGATLNQTGKSGKCILFDNVNDNIQLPDIAALQMYDQSFTVAYWVKPSQYGVSWNGVIGGENDCFAAGTYGSSGYANIAKNEAAGTSQTTRALTVNQWNLVVITFNSSATVNNVVIYVNNNGITTTMNVDFGAGASSNLIGSLHIGQNAFLGSLDELAIWKGTILSSGQITELYNANGVLYTAPAANYTNFIGGLGVINYVDNTVIASHNVIIPPAPVSGDTVEYILNETFTSWTNTNVRTLDGLMSKWDVSEANNDWDNQEIVNAGGDHGNVWRSWVNIGEWMSLETYVNLSNTYDDIWIRADYYVDPNFNHIGQGGGYSGKMFPGLYSGDENAHTDPMDTTTLGGRGGWFHLVWGSAGNPFLYRRDQIYNYLGYGEGGSLTPPKGYWSTVYVHVKNNTLGYTNGYVEAYQDGELKAKMTGTRTRSTAQGADYGKFERAIFSFFFGGEHTSVYASPRTQYIQMDNIAVYRFKPGANNYNASVKNIGASCPEVPALTVSVTPEHLLKNETYINPSDTIYDVGNDKSNIYWPPYGKTPIYKKVVRPVGTSITYSFVTEEFGYPDYGIPCEMYVKVYADTGANKGTALRTFGRTGVNNGRDPGYTNPSGTYTISSNRATFEMYPGCNGGITRGVAIKYDSKPSLLFVGNSTMVPIYNLFVSENAPYINNNIAVSGHYISQQLAAWNALTTAQKQSYDYVLLQIGLNDCVANDSTTTATAYQNLVNQINTDKKATCKIIAATLTPAKGSSVDDDKWLAINRAIRGQGANAVEGIDIVMETNTTGLDGNGDMVMDAQYDSGDHIHPNATGQAVIKSNYIEVLEAQ